MIIKVNFAIRCKDEYTGWSSCLKNFPMFLLVIVNMLQQPSKIYSRQRFKSNWRLKRSHFSVQKNKPAVSPSLVTKGTKIQWQKLIPRISSYIKETFHRFTLWWILITPPSKKSSISSKIMPLGHGVAPRFDCGIQLMSVSTRKFFSVRVAQSFFVIHQTKGLRIERVIVQQANNHHKQQWRK